MIIAIAGEAGHGKDTVGELLEEILKEEAGIHHNTSDKLTTLKFADALNRIVAALTGLPLEFVCTRSNYNYVSAVMSQSIREAKINIAHKLKELFGKDVFVKSTLSKIRPYDDIKITDLRFEEELVFLSKRIDTLLIFVHRPNHNEVTLNETTKNDISETGVKLLDKSLFHIILSNDDTRESLKQKLKKELKNHQLWSNLVYSWKPSERRKKM